MLISTTLQTPHATTTRKDEWSWQPESWGNHTAGDRPAWLIQLDWFSFAVCLSLGLAGNCLLLVQLVRVHLNGPRKTANTGRASNLASGERIRRQRGLLLGHQCVIDWLVCFITAIKLAGQNDGLGVNVSEHRVAAVCYLWSNNLLFWLLVITSVYGHVFIGLHTIYIFVSKLSRRSRGKWRDIQEILVIVVMPLLLAHALSAVTNFSMLLSIATFTPIDSDSYTLLTPGNCTTGFRLTDKLQSGTLLVSFVGQTEGSIIGWLLAVYAVPSVLLLIIGPLARVTQLRFLENCSQSEAGSPPRQVGQEEGAGGNIICLDVLPAAPVGSMGQQDKVDEAGFLIEKQKTKMFVRAEHIYLAVYMASSVADIAYCMILLFSSLRLGELLHPAYRMGSLVLNTSATTPWIYFYAVPELRPFLSRVDISSKANWLFSSIRRRRLNGNSQISSPTQPAKTAEQEVVDASPTLHSATVVTGVQEDKMEPTDGEPADVGLARSIVSLDPASTAIARPEIESQDLQATEEIEILRSEAEYRERLKSITDEEEDKLSEIEEIKEAEHSDGEELC